MINLKRKHTFTIKTVTHHDNVFMILSAEVWILQGRRNTKQSKYKGKHNVNVCYTSCSPRLKHLLETSGECDCRFSLEQKEIKLFLKIFSVPAKKAETKTAGCKFTSRYRLMRLRIDSWERFWFCQQMTCSTYCNMHIMKKVYVLFQAQTGKKTKHGHSGTEGIGFHLQSLDLRTLNVSPLSLTPKAWLRLSHPAGQGSQTHQKIYNRVLEREN